MSLTHPSFSVDQTTSVHYLRDTNISQFEDRQIRQLLRVCFNDDDQACIEERRFFFESPMHRFVIWDDSKQSLLAHAAFHEKKLYTASSSFVIGGVAEVAVAPTARGRGLVKQLVTAAEQKMLQLDIHHSVLFGDIEVYGSSGYIASERVHILSDRKPTSGKWVSVKTLHKTLSGRSWPDCTLYLAGKTF
ncbi:GNAT family N-acetyltransferase [Vibrio ulleungensis]|uniref:GNAT family N-acetyltransferase n=1 Tax=Vibrio ulleungensis TaxID=2807619 RepID=A0ABS2HHT9_9VIBR|nr:GNAT family N-acetyltransferase [Vibrio ulleungensis]MBM7037100.1 GNAT family N-acetyltransferase [Vibrio ulleungensis]